MAVHHRREGEEGSVLMMEDTAG